MATPEGVLRPEFGRIRAYPTAMLPLPFVIVELAAESAREKDVDDDWLYPVSGMAARSKRLIQNRTRISDLWYRRDVRRANGTLVGEGKRSARRDGANTAMGSARAFQ